ncbi:MAG: glycosyltransferase [Phycisphaerales bacterium]|nr:glycosyltransferase [Phycisphaerales bacterium]
MGDSAVMSAEIVRAEVALMPPHVDVGLKMLRTIVGAGDWALAIEAVAAIALIDIQAHQQAFVKQARAAAMLSGVYTQVFEAAGLRAAAHPPSRGVPSRRTRVLISTFALTDGQSASTSIVRWVELLDRNRYDVCVLCCEELTEREPALSIVKRPTVRSSDAGADVIRSIRAAGAQVEFVPTRGTLLDGCNAALDAARGFEPDVLLSVASPACPIQAALVHAGVAPVRLVMNIGVPLLMRGATGIVYHNEGKAADDAPVLEQLGIRQHRVATIGTDLRLCDAAPTAQRKAIGVPDDAVMLLSVGNVLVKRLTFAGFGEALARFLSRHPECWWVGVGRGDFAPVHQIMRRHGVADRVRTPGAFGDPRPIMKAADLLLNEYPEGGGNTVLEAMGCGLPVVAMHAGRGHAERIGAMLVGEDAIAELNVEAYWTRVQEWVRDRGARCAAGARQRARARAEFDYTAIVRGYERIIAEELLARVG